MPNTEERDFTSEECINKLITHGSTGATGIMNPAAKKHSSWALAHRSCVASQYWRPFIGCSAERRGFVSSFTLREDAKKSKPLSPEQQRFLDSALRVNHAGELAATRIYIAQSPPIIRAYPHLRPLMKHMYDQEAGHFKTFNELLAKHRVRPTVMYPVWQAAATVLGWGTAVMGREAAMACTEAVETEIGEHYNGQVRILLQWQREMAQMGESLGPELEELVSIIKRIRDEELEHLDHAVEHDAKEAQPYELLTNVIRSGCKAAIWISERV